MPLVKFVLPDGRVHPVAAENGLSLMRVAIDAGIDAIMADCGGAAACATCHVYVSPEWIGKLGPLSPDEADMIVCAVDPDERSRLSCQVMLSDALDGLTVIVPQSQL